MTETQNFYNKFEKYDECAPPGVLLPKIKIEVVVSDKMAYLNHRTQCICLIDDICEEEDDDS